MAYGLQASKVRSKIKEEEMQVKVVERQQNISIQEQEIMRKEKELDSKVKKPAEAEKYRLEKIAEAEKQRKVLPKVAAEVSAPLSQTEKITMVSDGDGPIGASKVTGEVLDIMNSLPAMVQNMTGVDIKGRMAKA